MLLNRIFAELLCSWVNSYSKDRQVFKAGLELFGVGSSSLNLNLTAIIGQFWPRRPLS